MTLFICFLCIGPFDVDDKYWACYVLMFDEKKVEWVLKLKADKVTPAVSTIYI